MVHPGVFNPGEKETDPNIIFGNKRPRGRLPALLTGDAFSADDSSQFGMIFIFGKVRDEDFEMRGISSGTQDGWINFLNWF